jgi:hypothetical protein
MSTRPAHSASYMRLFWHHYVSCVYHKVHLRAFTALHQLFLYLYISCAFYFQTTETCMSVVNTASNRVNWPYRMQYSQTHEVPNSEHGAAVSIIASHTTPPPHQQLLLPCVWLQQQKHTTKVSKQLIIKCHWLGNLSILQSQDRERPLF